MASSPHASVLFLTYNGLLEPLGRSQVLPYVIGLARRGHRMRVVSFEKEPARSPSWSQTAARLAAEGVQWQALRYHKWPPVVSTAFDAARGLASVLRAARHGASLVHARSHVPALIAELTRLLVGTPFLFDHRGLLAEEYAESGLWRRNGWLFRATEACERRFLRRAAGVVVLTERLREDLRATEAPVTVIPCAVDLLAFSPAPPEADRPYDLVHAGSWSGRYRGREMLAFFEAYRRRRPSARFLILMPRGGRLDPVPEGVDVAHAAPEEVPARLRTARAGLSFLGHGRAQRAASPVKVSEYLACGLPVVSTREVGDLDQVLAQTRTGLLVDGFSAGELDRAARALVDLLDEGREVVERCRRLAEQRYGLSAAVDAYDRAYRAVLAGPGL